MNINIVQINLTLFFALFLLIFIYCFNCHLPFLILPLILSVSVPVCGTSAMTSACVCVSILQHVKYLVLYYKGCGR